MISKYSAINPLPKPVQDAVTAACNAWGITSITLLSPLRTDWIVEARFATYALLYESGFTTRQIGRWLGRTHGSVTRGYRQYRDFISTDHRYKELFFIAKTRFQSANKITK
jgi:chromosomal replication initiation ATPase DnaA